ncbi:hypothetical protein CDD82_5967 [Ophiocordyceps australis]|uniref:DNA polymerase lambda n=1 Tax=Ophiocordyceps australis TaxID=1399860 RepID=A0A2C5Y300_9HYPO|nr:hypothetical protein CDD82_5967 [Ophiocordyceps australis]
MDSPRSRLDDKTAYFGLLESLNNESQDDASRWAHEQRDREYRLAFFNSTWWHGMAASQQPSVVKGTQSDARLKGQPLTVSPDNDVIADSNDETQSPHASNSSLESLSTSSRRSRRILPWATAREKQPWPCAMASAKAKRDTAERAPRTTGNKRQAKAGPRIRPREEQIFEALAFYYIPQDNPSTLRRARVNKAIEYGATVVDTPALATHIVADGHVTHQDITTWFSSNGLGHIMLPPIVTQDYAPDCIDFGCLLDHRQKKYQVSGQPTRDETRQEIKDKSTRDWPGSRLGPCAPDSHDTRSAAVADAAMKRDWPAAAQELDGMAGHDGRPDRQERQDCREDADELSKCISRMQQDKHDGFDSDEGPETGQWHKWSGDEEDSGSDKDKVGEWRPEKKRRLGGKNEGNKERFACHAASDLSRQSQNPNARTIEVLQSMAEYYDRTQQSWKTLSYRKAIGTLKRQKHKITREAEAFALPHIGQGLARKIEEIATTDKLRRLEYAQADWMDEVVQLFLGIYGVGWRQAQQWISQGHRTLEDLVQKVKLTASQKLGIEHYADFQAKMARSEVEALGAIVRSTAAQIDAGVEVIIGGSYRRGAQESGDIDVIMTKKGTRWTAELRPFRDRLVERLMADGVLTAQLASSRRADHGSLWLGCCVLPASQGQGGAVWRRIDLLVVPETERGAALLYFTGDDIFNRSMRLLASSKGMRLNQHGLFHGPGRHEASEGQLVEGGDERRIFEVLGVAWREPHERWC